ncbi:MAG TPA: SDR family oxidoreductase [Candidatus Acidoferrum sp.]
MERETNGWRSAVAVGAAGIAALVAIRAAVRRSRYMDLRGRVVLITGGSRGLGLALAREFADRGAKVAICARNANELDRVQAEFDRRGTAFLGLKCDVGVRGEIQRTIATVEEQFGPIDVLVNNAGTIFVGPIENQGIEAFEDALQTNFWAAVYATFAIREGMKRRGRGRIVNIASIGGKVAIPHLLAYSASKFALVGYSEGLRAELAKDNIFVTTVCPGLMRTGSPRNADFAGQAEKEYEWFAVSGSVPVVSMEVTRAARRVVDACVAGESEVHLGITAKLASLAHGLAPGLCAESLSRVNQLMPQPGDKGTRIQKGFESETPITASNLTKLTRMAEETQNQL